MGSRRLASVYRRTAAVGLLSASAVLVGLQPAGGEALAPVQEAPPAFSNGTAKATAVVARVAPGVGSLQLALRAGIAVADLKNAVAQSEAQAADLGLIGSTLSSEGCSGDPIIPASALPKGTRVDNRGGATAATSDEAPVAGPVLAVGREEVWADETPMAGARSTFVPAEGPSLLKLDGGRAEATTEVIDGASRQAHATVDVNLDIAGVVQLRGMRWEALHRTGADPHAEATFDLGTASLLGIDIPLESLYEVQDAVNQALQLTGITVQFPRVERFEEPADLVRITPLRIVLKDSQLGKTVLGPFLDVSRAQREQLFDELSGAICEAAGILLVGDIGVSIASGTGFLAVEIGGAEATTGELVLGNPFGPPVAPDGGGLPDAGVAPTPPPAGSPPPAVTPPPAPPTTAAPDGTGGSPIASVGPLEKLCETVHPAADTACSEGAMLPLGIIGLAATIGVGALDHRRQRNLAAAATGRGTEA